jgi:hypothetical protein
MGIVGVGKVNIVGAVDHPQKVPVGRAGGLGATIMGATGGLGAMIIGGLGGIIIGGFGGIIMGGLGGMIIGGFGGTTCGGIGEVFWLIAPVPPMLVCVLV